VSQNYIEAAHSFVEGFGKAASSDSVPCKLVGILRARRGR